MVILTPLIYESDINKYSIFFSCILLTTLVGKRCFGKQDWHAKGRTNVIGALLFGVLLTVSFLYWFCYSLCKNSNSKNAQLTLDKVKITTHTIILNYEFLMLN